jgi:hypothetical protein
MMMLQQPFPSDFIFVQNIVQTVMVSLVFIAVGWPLARAIGKRIERRAESPNILPDVVQRLNRIESAVDTVAVEVERMAEAQRFTTKLLAERKDLLPPNAGSR